jgi:hypothetical protein
MEEKMIKVRKEVKTYMVRAMCECGGEYEHQGLVLTSWPAQYPHECNRCGKMETFLSQYPKFEYKEVENDA